MQNERIHILDIYKCENNDFFNSSIQIKKKKERKTNIVAYFIREVSGAKPTIET